MRTRARDAPRLQRWIGLGALLALLWSARGGLYDALASLLSSSGQSAAHPWLWVCDRDDQALIGLCAEGLKRARLAVRHPLELERGVDGKLWLLYASVPGPQAPRRLVSLDRVGRVRFDLAATGLQGLVAWRAGSLVGLAGEPPRARVVHYEDQGAERELAQEGGWCALDVGVGGELWLLSARRLAKLDAPGAQLHAVHEFDVAHDFEALVATRAGAWLLERVDDGSARLSFVSARGEPRLELHGADLKLKDGPRFAVGDDRGGVWLVSERGAALHLDARGSVIARAELPLLGIEAVHAAPGGGIFALSAGALMHLDHDGALLPGQGGFRFACDLVASGVALDLASAREP